jgi:signal peptidase
LIAVCESKIFSQWQEGRAEERRNAVLKKIWNIVTTVVVCVVALLALLLVGSRILGLQTFVVLSGSMEPYYHVGSVIYVKEVPPETLKVGDDISFLITENTVATHRIVEVLRDGSSLRFRTKGTANTTTDDPVPQDRVLGKVVGTIPLLGYLFDFVKHPPGTYITLAAATVMVLVAFLPDIITGCREQKPAPTTTESTVDTAQLKAELEALKQQLQQQAESPPPQPSENVDQS